jgi:hypothetical protein
VRTRRAIAAARFPVRLFGGTPDLKSMQCTAVAATMASMSIRTDAQMQLLLHYPLHNNVQKRSKHPDENELR